MKCLGSAIGLMLYLNIVIQGWISMVCHILGWTFWKTIFGLRTWAYVSCDEIIMDGYVPSLIPVSVKWKEAYAWLIMHMIVFIFGCWQGVN